MCMEPRSGKKTETVGLVRENEGKMATERKEQGENEREGACRVRIISAP